MCKINWMTDNYETLGNYYVCVNDLPNGFNQSKGIKRYSKSKLILLHVVWPLFKVYSDLLVDGFIERNVGRLIKKYIESNTVFVEIGCGDMSLRRYVPKHIYYNALDLRFSEFFLRKVLQSKQKINLVIASCTDIPAPSNIASLVVSTETFEHIPEIDKAIKEIHRLSLPGAIIICSIPNNYCYKYHKKGSHSGHINNWTFEGFKQFMESHNFEFVEGFMKGWWTLPASMKLDKYKPYD